MHSHKVARNLCSCCAHLSGHFMAQAMELLLWQTQSRGWQNQGTCDSQQWYGDTAHIFVNGNTVGMLLLMRLRPLPPVAKLPCDVLLLGINGAGKTALLNILQLHSHAADKLSSEALPAAEPTTVRQCARMIAAVVLTLTRPRLPSVLPQGFFMRTIVAPMTKLTFRVCSACCNCLCARLVTSSA